MVILVAKIQHKQNGIWADSAFSHALSVEREKRANSAIFFIQCSLFGIAPLLITYNILLIFDMYIFQDFLVLKMMTKAILRRQHALASSVTSCLL